jgi:hypothetical protein
MRRGPTFLERWIITYLAELLAREASVRGAKRDAVRAEIGAVLPALWEQQLARDAIVLREAVDYWERRVEAADEKTAAFLCMLIEAPDEAASIAAGRETFAIRWLMRAEELLSRFGFAVKAAAEAASDLKHGSEREVIVTFGRRDKTVGELREAAAALVPELAMTSDADVPAIEHLTTTAIVRAMQARLVIAMHVSVMSDGKRDGESAGKAGHKTPSRLERDGATATRVARRNTGKKQAGTGAKHSHRATVKGANKTGSRRAQESTRKGADQSSTEEGAKRRGKAGKPKRA